MIGAFENFIDELKHPTAQLRENFRKKFLVSYGIELLKMSRFERITSQSACVE